jgi:Protein of unknown function (DUF2462)
MAQGNLKKNLKKAPKSAGSQKRKVLRTKTAGKGPKVKTARRSRAMEAAKPEISVTKQICKKNEAYVAAKVVASGNKLLVLNDMTEKGSKRHEQEIRARDKKQTKGNSKMTNRLKDQIQQLQKGTKMKKN